MEEQKGTEQQNHGGMDHGIGMMLGCIVPMAAIVLLPRMGVSPAASLAIGIVGMLLIHAGMSVVHKLKNRVAGNRVDAHAAGHNH